MPQGFQREALARTCEALGDVSILARRLGVATEALQSMVEGREAIPTWLFLRTVDLLNEHQAQNAPPTSDPPPLA